MSHFDGKKDPTLPAKEEGPYRKTVAFKQKKTQTQKMNITHTQLFFSSILLLLLIEAMDTSTSTYS